MAERVFEVLATTVDALLCAQPAGQGYTSGDAWFASAPKELRGSLLKVKDGKDFDPNGGGAKFAMIRTNNGLVVTEGQAKLRLSITGAQGGSRLVSREELAELCESAVVGVLADNGNATGRAGMHADKVGTAQQQVRLVPIEAPESHFAKLRAFTVAAGVAFELTLTVEEAVAKFNLTWLPWVLPGPAREFAHTPAYEASMDAALQPGGDAAVRSQVAIGEAAARAVVLRNLGLAGANGEVQVGEVCALAVALVARPMADGDRLRARLGDPANQRELAEALYKMARELTRLQPGLWAATAGAAGAAVQFLVPQLVGAMAKGTAGIHGVECRRLALLADAGPSPGRALLIADLARAKAELVTARGGSPGLQDAAVIAVGDCD